LGQATLAWPRPVCVSALGFGFQPGPLVHPQSGVSRKSAVGYQVVNPENSNKLMGL